MANSIVFLATAWGVKHGGINSFNRDLAASLASIASSGLTKIICVVPVASEEEKKDAEGKGVILSTLSQTSSTTNLPQERAYEIVEKLKEHSPTWWIGHDVKTGPAALKAREINGGHCALIHHMDYEAYLPYYDNYPSDIISFQRHILSEANIVFSVGPKLARSAEDKLRSKINRKVVELTPGLASIRGRP